MYMQHFKYFVGQGNNSFVVEQALKRRFWWTRGCREEDDWEDFNFIWTQWRKDPIVKSLKTEKEVNINCNNACTKNPNGSNTNDDCTTCITRYSPNDIVSESENKNSSLSIEKVLNPSFSGKIKSQSKIGIKVKNATRKVDLTVVDLDQVQDSTIYSHLEGNYHLSNKKALFYNMREF